MKLTDKAKTQKIFSMLKERCENMGNVIPVPEFRFGTSYNGGCSQRQIDMFTIGYAKGNETISYEIKVSRSDFMNDLKNEEKQRGARMFSDYFYYCTPKGLLKPEEIPVWAGLYEFNLDDEESKNNLYSPKIVCILSAPHLPRENPTWELIISALRRVDVSTREKIKAEIDKFNRNFCDKWQARKAYQQEIWGITSRILENTGEA